MSGLERGEEVLSTWSSWLIPMLRVANHRGVVKDIIETGSGEGSKLMLEHLDPATLLSIEVDPGWAERSQTKDPRHTVVHAWKGEPSYLAEKVVPLNHRYDFALVDGINENRAMCANIIMMHDVADVLFVHDFGADEWDRYRWEFICKPDDWDAVRVVVSPDMNDASEIPTTGVFSKDVELMAKLRGWMATEEVPL